MTKVTQKIEQKNGRYGFGHYVTIAYQKALGLGEIVIGPYNERQNAQQHGDIVAHALSVM